MQIDYNNSFLPFKNKFEEVMIPKGKADKIKEFVNELIKIKQEEPQHKIDCYSEKKRFMTGLIGEAAIEEFFHINIIDWTIGDSIQYNIPDIHIIKDNEDFIKTGIKTVEYGKFPVIFKENNYPQIINVIAGQNKVLICGLAYEQILNTFQSEELILSSDLRKRGIKTGFYGFKYLISPKNMAEHMNIKNILKAS